MLCSKLSKFRLFYPQVPPSELSCSGVSLEAGTLAMDNWTHLHVTRPLAVGTQPVSQTAPYKGTVPETLLTYDTNYKFGRVPRTTLSFNNSLEGLTDHTASY